MSMDGPGWRSRGAKKGERLIKEKKKRKETNKQGEEKVEGGMKEERNPRYRHRGTVEGVPPTV